LFFKVNVNMLRLKTSSSHDYEPFRRISLTEAVLQSHIPVFVGYSMSRLLYFLVSVIPLLFWNKISPLLVEPAPQIAERGSPE